MNILLFLILAFLVATNVQLFLYFRSRKEQLEQENFKDEVDAEDECEKIIDAILLFQESEGGCCIHVLRYKLLHCGIHVYIDELEGIVSSMEDSGIHVEILSCEEDKSHLN